MEESSATIRTGVTTSYITRKILSIIAQKLPSNAKSSTLCDLQDVVDFGP